MNSSKYKKLLNKIPKELSDILDQIKYKWRVLSYRTQGPGWHAEVEIKGRKFYFSSEYSYISVRKQKTNNWQTILPPEDQRKSITSRQIAVLVNAELA